MLNEYAAQWKSRFQSSVSAGLSGGSHRVGHGATAWSLPSDAEELRQPQDGAIDTRARVAEIRPHLNRAFLNEPEDARLTGGTRSLGRRLLGLNVMTAARAVAGAAQAVVPQLAVPQLSVARAVPARVKTAGEAQVA
jgi:hypothetical protein